jgi:hypothetical protein
VSATPPGGRALAAARARLARARAERRDARRRLARNARWRPVAGGHEKTVGPWRLRVEPTDVGWRWVAFFGRTITVRRNGAVRTPRRARDEAAGFARRWRP